MRYLPVLFLVLTFCTSPGQVMKAQHAEFWNDIVGSWEILPEGQTESFTVEFSGDLKVKDPKSFFCGFAAAPNYWTGETPAGTLFSAEQSKSPSERAGSATLQKMEFKRGQFMVVCNGKQMNYIDHVIFYGLSESAAKFGKTARPLTGSKFAVMKEEDGRIRRFAYRKLAP